MLLTFLYNRIEIIFYTVEEKLNYGPTQRL